jgi:AbrB family looped-hinge helix DNA binding protein
VTETPEEIRGLSSLPPQSRLTCGIANGMLHTMRTTTDAAGRLVIPKEIRREAGLKPGMALEVRWREGHIEIEPAPLPVKLTKRGRLLVAVPEEQVERLLSDTVERTRRRLRQRRTPA